MGNTEQGFLSFKKWIILFFLFTAICSYSQKTNNIWYFGYNNGLDFTNGTPVELTNGQMRTLEGCATVCDPCTGKLLFYTDGKTVWNRLHQQMPNGFDLFGDRIPSFGGSSTQAAIIVPKPGTPSVYYIFTSGTGAYGTMTDPSLGINYSVVDICADNGNGDVVQKNIPLYKDATEKLTAVMHQNGNDVWVITHEYHSNRYITYLVTSAGVSATPVISATGVSHTPYMSGGNVMNASEGQMKVSSDRKKIAITISNLGMEVLNFNASTGIIGSSIVRIPPSNSGGPFPIISFDYGIEFSPDSRWLYRGVNYGGNFMYQYDLSKGNSALIQASETKIDISPIGGLVNYGSMQLRPDGKIYVMQYGTFYIATINNPNSAGTACNFVSNTIKLYKKPGFGIPQIVVPDVKQISTITPDFSFTNACGEVKFKDESIILCPDTLIQRVWNFGDPASGANNTSSVIAPTHLFSAPGNYTVQLIINAKCDADTVVKQLTVPPFPQADFTLISNCSDLSVVFTNHSSLAGNGSLTYSWKFGDNATETSSAPTHLYTTPGTYQVWLVAATPGDCKDSISKTVILSSILPGITVDTSRCEGDNVVFQSSQPGADSYRWSTTGATSSITTATPGTYWVESKKGGCTYVDTFKLATKPYPIINLRDTSICLGDTITLDAGTDGNLFSWNTGEVTQQIKVYTQSDYIVTVTKNGCSRNDTSRVKTGNISVEMSDVTACQGTVVTLDPGNISGAIYSWSTGSSASSVSTDTSGVYWITISRNNCKGYDTVAVTILPLPVVVLKDTARCAVPGETIQLDAGNAGASYNWSNGVTTQQATITTSGTYTVIVNQNGCTATGSATVTFHSFPVTNLRDTILCGTGMLTLNVEDNQGTYSWNTGETTPSINITASGLYALEINTGFCSVKDTSRVIFAALPVVDLGKDTAVCTGEPLKLFPISIQHVATYLWSNGSTDAFISTTGTGNYWLTVTSPEGCQVTDTFHLQVNELQPISNNFSLCEQELAAIDAGNPGSIYLWNTGETYRQISVTKAGKYWVDISKDGCKLSDTVEVRGEPGAFSLFIPNAFTPNQDGKNELFTASGTGVTTFKMEVFDRWGNLFFVTEDMNKGWDGSLDGKVVQQDVYIWLIHYSATCDAIEKSYRRLGHVSVIK